jgi:hypothetical protein
MRDNDAQGRRCLVGAVDYLRRKHRIPSGEAVSFLREAMPRRGFGLVYFNDHRCRSVAELRSVIVKARALAAMAGLVLGLSAGADVALAQALGNSQVVQPNSNEFGNTYGEWSARWWQWLVSIPAATNPNLTSGIVDCTLGQSGQVWFLGGSFGDKPSYTRSCTIESGKDLLVTPLTALFGELGPTPESDCPNGPNACDPTLLRSSAAEGQDDPQLLEVRVDNAQVKNVDQYRVTSPVFSAFFPENAILPDSIVPGGTVPQGSHGPLISDGYFVLLKPLSPGPHTIHLKGVSNGGFTVEVTYHLTVTK